MARPLTPPLSLFMAWPNPKNPQKYENRPKSDFFFTFFLRFFIVNHLVDALWLETYQMIKEFKTTYLQIKTIHLINNKGFPSFSKFKQWPVIFKKMIRS